MKRLMSGIIATMRKYDLTVLLKADVKNEAKDKFVDRIDKTVKAVGGVLVKTTEMGVKQLAYRIGGAAEAQYMGWVLELPGEGVVQLGHKLTIDKEILRHMLVKSFGK